MKSLIQKIYFRLIKRFYRRPKVTYCRNLIAIGTKYGGWTIPDNYLTKDSIIYLVGAGEDLSFDCGIVEKYKSKVYIFDPTPRAKIHFDSLINGINQNKKVPINNVKNDFYKIKKENLMNLEFIELGIWDKKEDLKFYAPKKSEHVSHSIINLQKTEKYFIAKVDRLSNIMKQLNHKQIDLLKIDIEGAEYNVIETIIQDNIKINVLCVEFDEAANPLDHKYMFRIKESITKLMKYGFKIIAADSNHNYTFIQEKELKRLKSR